MSDDDERFGSVLLAPPPQTMESAALTRLHERLADDAERAGVLDVAYTTVDSPVGTLLLAATDRGLLRVAFEREGLDTVLEALGARVGPRLLRAPRRLDAVSAQLDEYFAGLRTAFDVPLDLALSSGFRRLVQQQLPRIGYGTTQTYKEVALAVGNPGAVRAVGSACATNPLPIVVPCHRVLRTDGGLGGYIGGEQAKSALLALEAA
jgi:methylated-DNA-[protein]-cysteine S-methyltransferase